MFPIIITEKDFNEYITQKHKIELKTIVAVINGFKEMENKKLPEPIETCPKCHSNAMNEMGDNLSYCENCGEHADTIPQRKVK
jgi:hypothetical protein